MLLALIPAAFVMVQPDLGSAWSTARSSLAILFFAGTPSGTSSRSSRSARSRSRFVLVAAPAAGVEVLHGYQKDRLTSFLHPSPTPTRRATSRTSRSSPSAPVRRPAAATTRRRRKLNFLPEHHTDFIIAVVGERWGFVGAALVLSLYALLIWRGLRILTMAKDLFGALVAGGIVAMLLFQVFVNVGMTLGIMPITGIPLPLMSYGGSSVVTTLLAIGLLQSIYVQGRSSAATKGRIMSH